MMCGALEQGACDNRGKPKNGAGGIPAEKWSRPPKGNATVEGAGEGYSGSESVGSAGCSQRTNGQEESTPLEGGNVPRGSPSVRGAGDDCPAAAGPGEDAGSGRQTSSQPPKGDLVGVGEVRARAAERSQCIGGSLQSVVCGGEKWWSTQ